MSGLFDAWLSTAGTTPAAAAVGRDLLARWGEPHRRYHTLDHLVTVLAVIDDHAAWAHDPAAVRLAAWYHDAVYDPRRVDNEEASALLAEEQLPDLELDPGAVSEVARLVRLTASHDPAAGDRNGELLTDADLAVLTAGPDTYHAYTAAIRAEYAHVPDEAFVAGRAVVLRTLLALPRLFHLPTLRERWEEQARRNMARELVSLGDDALPFRPA